MHDRARDIRDLTIMHMRDHDGMTCAAIGQRLGLSRGKIIGITYRVCKAAEDHPCACAKPENRDGGMPPMWWAA